MWRAGPNLEADVDVRGDALSGHGRIVGAPSARWVLGSERRIERGPFKVVGDQGLASQCQGIDHQCLPGDDATGFDGVVDERVAGGLFAGRKPARIAEIEAANARPMVEKRLAERRVARDAMHLGQTLQAVQAFPARPRRAEELASLQPNPVIVAGPLDVLEHLAGHGEVAVFAGAAIEDGEAVEDAHVHFVRPGIDDAEVAAGAGAANEIGDPPCRLFGLLIARLIVPEEQSEHDVVVAPKIPLTAEPLVLGPGPQIAVGVLQCEEPPDDFIKRGSELRAVRHAHGLHARNEVLAHEFAGPGHQIGRSAAVAAGEHLEQARIVGGRRDQPVVDIGPDTAADEALKLPTGIGDGLQGVNPARGRRFSRSRRRQRRGKAANAGQDSNHDAASDGHGEGSSRSEFGDSARHHGNTPHGRQQFVRSCPLELCATACQDRARRATAGANRGKGLSCKRGAESCEACSLA